MQYATLREKIAAEKTERLSRYASFAALLQTAHAAAEAAAKACRPTPMVVSQHASPLDDSSPVTQQWHVASGACGFGTVRVRNANSSFCRWALQQGHLATKSSYHGGIFLNVHPAFTANSPLCQSYDINSAYAYAYAKALCAAGIDAFADCRLD